MSEPAAPISLATPLSELPGVGPARRRALKRLGLERVNDLLRHLPARYERVWAEGSIADLPMSGVGTARGTVVAARWVPAGAGKGRFEATLQDHSERLSLTWFNAAYLRRAIHAGMLIRVTGKVKPFNGYAQMANPKWEPLADSEATPAREDRLRPIYPATEELPSEFIERLVAAVLPAVIDRVTDPLPGEMARRLALPGLADALRWAHTPEHADQAAAARRRLAFNELLLLQLGISLKRHDNDTRLLAPALRWSPAIDAHIRARFPFTLTPAQDRVVSEIAADLQRTRPMNRLLQGDVGAGKTLVALYAMLLAVADRRQAALMAPTELLAEQHHRSLSHALADSSVRMALLTGGRGTAAQRRKLLEGIQAGECDLVIGTQALLTQTVRFHDLALIVIDEQHRFGVLQRAAFRGKTGRPEPAATQDPGAGPQDLARNVPHCLVMTATPIPRTLSLTVFGDLDVSVIDGLPPGRTPVTTRVVPPEKAADVYAYLKQRLERGEQAYVVVPAIDSSKGSPDDPALAPSDEPVAAEKPDAPAGDALANVEDHVRDLGQRMGPAIRVAGVHGRMDAEERERVMHAYRSGEVALLVATTVIEVGVDVPNATLMVVEHAERFGLAQLHQLRGRIGRGSGRAKPLCVFIAQAQTDDARSRLDAIASTTDGFKIAEHDLQIRGMGDFFGTRQHGLPPLRVASIPADMDLLQQARREAQALVAADPLLQRAEHLLLRRLLIKQYGDALGLIDVG